MIDRKTSSDEESDTESMDVASISTLLTNDRCALVVESLIRIDSGDAEYVSRVTDRIASQEGSSLWDEDQGRGSISAALHQTLLPQLAAAEVIEYDREAGEIRRGPHYEKAHSVLSDMRGES